MKRDAVRLPNAADALASAGPRRPARSLPAAALLLAVTGLLLVGASAHGEATSIAAARPVIAATPPGQDAPSTDVWLLEIEETPDGFGIAGEPVNVTARPGYDNQPAFTFDGRWLLYTSQRDGQTDIWAREVEAGENGAETVQLTDSELSEYSPTPVPGVERFSLVRVEEDGRQRLWSFPYPVELGGDIIMTPGAPVPPRAPVPEQDAALFLEDIEPVGYHAWVDPELMLFILGEPPTLQRVQLGDREGRVIARDIGRSLQPIPDARAISLVDKSVDPWMIRRYDLDADEIIPLAPVLGDGEDHCWSPGGLLVMGRDSELAVRRPGTDGDWRVVADLSDHGIQGITRLAFSPFTPHLAMVAAED